MKQNIDQKNAIYKVKENSKNPFKNKKNSKYHFKKNCKLMDNKIMFIAFLRSI